MQLSHQSLSKIQAGQVINLVLSATFTIEPIEQTLLFWMKKLSIEADIEFAPYNQVFQQLLDPSSQISRNHNGVNIIFLRVEDWCRFDSGKKEVRDLSSTIQRNAQDFVAAFKASMSQSTVPYILCLCPASSTIQAEQMAFFQAMEAWIVSELSDIRGLHLIQFQDVQALYPVVEYYNQQRDQLGHIPFTSEFFTALGTAIARRIYAIKHPAHKVIVLDCDNTLWKGVVGEDGFGGIDISHNWQTIQEFMVAQNQAGMLLCLCSKNNESDVIQVFEERQDMPLKLQHLVAWRINWLPKSENLKSLAAELNLGLDSFIFIDDNPVECTEVRANCPEVLTLQLPAEGNIQQFLSHIWAFDHLQVTQEDTQRTVLYQQNVQRQRFQQQALTMNDFLAGLEMTIEIAAVAPTQLSRVAQLTQRTNQFNFTTVRRTEVEIQQLAQLGIEAHVVSVRDRFGDYGLVGVMLFSTTPDTLNIDTFLLSCRVLGRGVEHEMVRYLGRYAEAQGLTWINLTYLPTQKNQPAFNFLNSIVQEHQVDNPRENAFRLSIHQAKATTYTAVITPPASLNTTVPEQPRLINAETNKSDLLRQIAIELYTPHEILVAIRTQQQSTLVSVERSIVDPRTSTENDLSNLWSELLGIHPIGITENYFELGGTSLQAVELFAQIEQYFGQRLPLTSLLEAPTIEALATLIDLGSASYFTTDKSNSVIPLNQAKGVTPPLFLIHPGSGDVLLYRNLAQRLQSVTSVYAIKPYSRNGYPIVHTEIPEMAAYYIQQIQTMHPEGPYLLGGFCGGGVIAFEMALQLQQQGFVVPLVALMHSVDVKEPKRWEPIPQRKAVLKNMIQKLKTKVKISLYKYYMSREIHPPRFVRNMSVMSVYQFAANTYLPQAQFKGNLILFKSKENNDSDEVNRFYGLPDPLLGWGKRTVADVQLYENMGDFEEILQEPYVKEISEQLQSCIDKVV